MGFDTNVELSRNTRTYTTDDVTIIIKSFLRFGCLQRLVRSIRYWHPDVRIMIGDDSLSGDKQLPAAALELQRMRHLQWLQFPFDTGLAKVRNIMVRQCRTRIIVNCDDDFVFTEETNLEALLEVLSGDASIDVCCGLARQGAHAINWTASIEFSGNPPRQLKLHPIATPWQKTGKTWYRETHLGINWFAAKREALISAPWDDRFKIVYEHFDHFLTMYRQGIKVVYTPNSIVAHLPARFRGYKKWRMRHDQFRPYFLKKWNLKRAPSLLRQHEPAVADRDVESLLGALQVDGRPNIVVLAVGHSNSTLLVRQIAALGWNTGDADEEYAESVSVRAVNQEFLRTRKFDVSAAAEALKGLSQPWVVKDPRFRRSLNRWIDRFRPYRPLLVWLIKDLTAVAASHQRRGESTVRIALDFESCGKLYQQWPWAKVQLRAEDIANASLLVDPARIHNRSAQD